MAHSVLRRMGCSFSVRPFVMATDLALRLRRTCRTRGFSTKSLAPRFNPGNTCCRLALARPCAFSAFIGPITPKPQATVISRLLDDLTWAENEPVASVALAPPVRSFVQDALAAVAEPLDSASLAQIYPERLHEERKDGSLLSFFIPNPPLNRHVVLRDKERLVTRRHGTLLRSGQALLPDEVELFVPHAGCMVYSPRS